MGDFVRVASTTDVKPGQAVVVEVNGKTLAVFNVDGAFHAIGQVGHALRHHAGEGRLERAVAADGTQLGELALGRLAGGGGDANITVPRSWCSERLLRVARLEEDLDHARLGQPVRPDAGRAAQGPRACRKGLLAAPGC